LSELQSFFSILQTTHFFQGITDEEMPQIIACLAPTVRSFQKEETVIEIDEQLPGIGIVLAGELTISKMTFSGDCVRMEQLLPADTFGGVAVFVGSSKAPATIVASMPSTVLFISVAHLTGEVVTKCPGYHKLITNTLQLLAKKAFFLNKKIDLLIIKSMRGKIAAFLMNLYKETGSRELQLPFNRNGFAEYLHVSRPSLSRELGELQKEGVIAYEKNRVVLLDIETLMKQF